MKRSEISLMHQNWVFSLTLPSTGGKDPRTVDLALYHERTKSNDEQQHQSSSAAAPSMINLAKCSEIKSLLDDEVDGIEIVHRATYDDGDCCCREDKYPKECWKFYSSVYGLTLQSSSLLRLSYKPAWQSIPEYTKGKRQRSINIFSSTVFSIH